MFTDEHRCKVWNEIRQRDIRAFSRQLTPAVLAKAALRAGVKLGKSPLGLANLVWLGIAAAIHGTQSFGCILTMTLRLLEDQQQSATKLHRTKGQGKQRNRNKRSKHDPRRDDPTVVSEAAFAKARQRMPMTFWIELIFVLGEQFEEQHSGLHTFRGFRVLELRTAVDDPEPEGLFCLAFEERREAFHLGAAGTIGATGAVDAQGQPGELAEGGPAQVDRPAGGRVPRSRFSTAIDCDQRTVAEEDFPRGLDAADHQL